MMTVQAEVVWPKSRAESTAGQEKAADPLLYLTLPGNGRHCDVRSVRSLQPNICCKINAGKPRSKW